MFQKAFIAEFNQTFRGFDSNAAFPSLLQHNAFSLQCKDIWASAPKSADGRIPLAFFFFCAKTLGRRKKSYCNCNTAAQGISHLSCWRRAVARFSAREKAICKTSENLDYRKSTPSSICFEQSSKSGVSNLLWKQHTTANPILWTRLYKSKSDRQNEFFQSFCYFSTSEKLFCLGKNP